MGLPHQWYYGHHLTVAASQTHSTRSSRLFRSPSAQLSAPSAPSRARSAAHLPASCALPSPSPFLCTVISETTPASLLHSATTVAPTCSPRVGTPVLTPGT